MLALNTTPAELELLSVEAIAAAKRRIHPHLPRTPTVYSHAQSALLKLENLQVTGAYKVRGALNALSRGVEAGDRRDVIAASAGNHGAGVAWAARALGLRSTIVVPKDAPQAKVDQCKKLGARVVTTDGGFEFALLRAQRLSRACRWRFIHAFDDLDVIAGQSTLGLEILAEEPDVVLVPIGGGGLAAGVGTVLANAGVRVVGVQVAGVDAMAKLLKGNSLTGFKPKASVADSLIVRRPGHITRCICAKVLDDVVVVTEEMVRAAMRSLLVHDHVVAEGAGAVAVAALPLVSGERKMALVTGGNVDANVVRDVLCADTPAQA